MRVLRDGNPEFSITVREVREALAIFCQYYELSIRGIDVVLTDSASQIRHNTYLLNHQYDTDVITQERETPMGRHLELYINSTAVFLENNETSQSYILRMVFHGLLHVVGLTDGSAIEKRSMHLEEHRLLHLFHVEHKP